MRRISKNHPPGSLITYARKVGASYDTMDADIKEELKESLLNEQGWICGYCQQAIVEKSKMKIEHFCEQSICNGEKGVLDRRLDYTNLMAVCLGDAGFNGLHCDSKKATFNSSNGLPMEVSPWIQGHMNGIRYHSTGIIDSTNKRHASEINSILNLNIQLLKDLRKKKFSKIYSLSKHKNPATEREKMRRILERDLDNDNNRFSNSFPGLSEYMLNRFC